MIKVNRIRQGNIHIQYIEEDETGHTHVRDSSTTFKDWLPLINLNPRHRNEDANIIFSADLNERVLHQGVLRTFKYLLDQCGVNYRT